jgi:N-acyl-L-homoserine lactone synthetase
MIKILTSADRTREPKLFRQMFEGRASIFADRLNWEVEVVDGQEIDRYDELEHTLYIVALDQHGDVAGSLRLLPTTGETMMRNEFATFFDEPVDVISPSIIECTRFCVHRPSLDQPGDVARAVSSELSIALCELCLSSGFEQVLGLYNAPMDRVYRRIGWRPEMLTENRSLRGHLRVGIWDATPQALANMYATKRSYEAAETSRAAA